MLSAELLEYPAKNLLMEIASALRMKESFHFIKFNIVIQG